MRKISDFNKSVNKIMERICKKSNDHYDVDYIIKNSLKQNNLGLKTIKPIIVS